MKLSLLKTILFGSVLFISSFFGVNTFAQSFEYSYSDPYYHNYYGNEYNNDAYIQNLLRMNAELRSRIAELESRLNYQNTQQNYTYYQPYNHGYNSPYTFAETSYSHSSSSNTNRDEDPDVDTDSARDIDENSAELRGDIDMNDFRNGIVFFVYGQDENRIRDVERDYNEYRDVNDDEKDDEFEVIKVDSDLDGRDSYERDVAGLERDERYYFVLCVEYDDEDNDEELECGDIEDFRTDN